SMIPSALQSLLTLQPYALGFITNFFISALSSLTGSCKGSETDRTKVDSKYLSYSCLISIIFTTITIRNVLMILDNIHHFRDIRNKVLAIYIPPAYAKCGWSRKYRPLFLYVWQPVLDVSYCKLKCLEAFFPRKARLRNIIEWETCREINN
ncbi:MAG TPA: hypothetical protein VHD35_10000, partial [Chitinophagaceae bacterium]|nr:hypothetical protein [Chitinophagaceae bacterium]